MNGPVMHSEAAPRGALTCEVCQSPFTPKRGSWARFCSTRCRNAFHGSERRLEAIKAAGPRLYAALAGLTAVEGPVGEMARSALAGLKPPVEPKALLEKAKA